MAHEVRLIWLSARETDKHQQEIAALLDAGWRVAGVGAGDGGSYLSGLVMLVRQRTETRDDDAD